MSPVRYDDPIAVARAVAALPAPPLLGFDVDGVLAPIVRHAADAALAPGVLADLIALAAFTPVAVVSGRSVDDLARFGFPASLMVAGSHGAERRGLPFTPLSALEHTRLDRLTSLADAAAADAGPGAWVEHKPTAVVLHVREAKTGPALPAVDQLRTVAARVAGAQVRLGHGVVELSTRPASKATAIASMRHESGAASVAYVGDDITDEDVFATLAPSDLGIRVGPGTTRARARLATPADAARYLSALVSTFEQR